MTPKKFEFEEILGLAKLQGNGRIYFPKDVSEKMGLSQEDEVSFRVSDRVEITGEEVEDGVSRKIKSQGRLTLPDEIIERLSLEKEDTLMISKEKVGNRELFTLRTATKG